MVAVANNFEAGTNGTTITTGNSGGGSGTAFDAVTIGAGATVVFDNTHPRGGLSAKLSVGATPSDSGVEWSTAVGTLGTWWQRIYYYATAHPTNQHRIMDTTTAAGAALNAGIYHQAAGTLGAADSTFGLVGQGTVAVPLNQWVRVEMKVIGSATVGQVEFKLFPVPDGPNPVETITSTAVRNTAGSGVIYRFGFHGDTYDANRTVWIDDPGVSSVGYLGPAVRQPVQLGVPQSIVRAGWW